MLNLDRFFVVGYVLSALVGGYLVVATLKGMWTTAVGFHELAAVTAEADRTVLVYDSLEPAVGEQK